MDHESFNPNNSMQKYPSYTHALAVEDIYIYDDAAVDKLDVF